MSGIEMIGMTVHSVALVFLGWGFIYREAQYTLLSWLALVGIISNAVGLGSLLVNS